LSSAEKINVYHNKGAGYEGLIQSCFYAIIISGIAYVTTSLFLLRQYRKSIEDEFSNIEKINLAWLRYLVYGIAVIWIAVIIGNDTVIFGIVVLFVFFLGYFGIRQTGIFTLSHPPTAKLPVLSAEKKSKEPETSIYQERSPHEENNHAETNGVPPKIKYEKSGLGGEQAEKIYKQLVGCMTNQKLFSDSELTLAALAKTLDVHPNHLSQVINSYEGKNFYDYINFHRVEEFKKLAPRPDNNNYTLLSMAYECGFNSKTSFNRNFKKVTGISPSEYLLQQHISLK
jgi:AraC-like DNA-binding protein